MFLTVGKVFVRFLLEQAVDRIFQKFQLSLTSQVEEGTELVVEGLGVEGMAGGDKDMDGADMWVV